MKRKIMALSILLGVLLLTVCAINQAEAGWKLEKELNPEGKNLWVVVSDREIAKVFSRVMRRYHISKQGIGFRVLSTYETWINSGYPLATAFSPDQISLKRIDPKYHYLFVIPIERLKEILAEDKCVIVSAEVRINIVRRVLDDKGEWVTVSKIEEKSYITLIAAPNKRTLKKAITRFFTLSEIPLEPIIWKPK